MAITAHLNGGPQDDAILVVEQLAFYVAGRIDDKGILQEDIELGTVYTVGTKRGIYRLRRDGLGQRVPHDLSGAVEFDWQGWDR